MLNRDYQTFVFTHIPKCGGSSFRKYVAHAAINSGIDEKNVHVPGFCGKANDKNINQLKPEELSTLRNASIKVIADHSQFNVHQNFNLNLASPYYYTILREPVARFISHYNFFYYRLGYGNCKDIHLNDLEERRRNEIIRTLSNVQVSYIANRKHKFEKEVNTELYMRAIVNLERHFACFGILEKMDKSIKFLEKFAPDWLHLKGTFPVENKNKISQQLDDVSFAIKEHIRFENRFDVDLYEFASKLFDLRYHSLFIKSI